MSISVIASTSAIAGAVSTHTTSSFNSTGAGLIEVTVVHANGTGPSVVDSKGNFWNALTPRSTTGKTVIKFYAYCYATGLNGSGHTVTVNFNANSFSVVMVRAYAGTNLTFGSENGATATAATSINAGSVTPAASQGLVTSGFGWDSPITSLAISGGSLAIIASYAWVNAVNYGGAYADEIQTSATARNPAWSWGNGRDVCACSAAYSEGSVPPTSKRLAFLESFDGYGGSDTQWAKKWTRNAAVLSTSHPQAGTYGAGFASGTNAGRALSLTGAFAGSAILVGFYYYWVSGQAFTDLCMLVSSGTGFNGFNAVCALDNDSSGQLVVARGGNRGTGLATSSPCLNASALNFIQFYYDVQDSGTYNVYCNGVQVLTGSADLAPGTSPATLAAIDIGCATALGWDSVFVFGGVTAADIIADANPTVSMFRPSTGNGANTGLTPSTGTDHGALVDEATANDDTDYNSGGAGVKDTYIFDTSALTGLTIYGVVLTMVVKATSAGTNTIRGITRISGVDYVGTTQAITTSYAYYEEAWIVKPSDGSAWAASSTMEFGVESVASAAANRVTAVYLEVLSATPPSTGAARLVGEMRIKTRLVGGVLA